MSNKFTIGKVELEYFDHPYNNTSVNERRVEVPLGQHFCNLFNDGSLSFIEVGAVMPYYQEGYQQHHTIDLFDPHPDCIKLDALKENYTNGNVLSISTIEHIGTSDYGATPSDPHDAFKCLQKIISEAKHYLITWPAGYNVTLDDDLSKSNIPYIILERLDAENNWRQLPFQRGHHIAVKRYKYSEPYTCGNAIVVITNVEDYK
jgi:hypothetical protein